MHQIWQVLIAIKVGKEWLGYKYPVFWRKMYFSTQVNIDFEQENLAFCNYCTQLLWQNHGYIRTKMQTLYTNYSKEFNKNYHGMIAHKLGLKE